MPITPFQREVLQLLAVHRNPNSYVAGGVAIQRSTNSSRYSNDIDFFHDTDEAVTQSVREDLALLGASGFEIEKLIEQPSFVRVVIRKGREALKLEWVRDTAYLFFPVVADSDLGYRLHDVDLAVNKCLALANRDEVRDIIDIIDLDSSTLSLPAIVWAACGKDPGFTPTLMLELLQRHSVIRPEQLAAEALREPLDAPTLKKRWLQLLKTAEQGLSLFPSDDIGCVYCDEQGAPIARPDQHSITNAVRHYGSVGGSWPRLT